jgi:tRNA(Ile)-lysidine synthetase-like protein
MELGGGFEAEVSFDRVRIAGAVPREAASAVSLGVPDHGAVQWGSWTFTWRTEAAEETTRESAETWVTTGTLTVRGVGQGDRLIPLGGVGRRKVRRLLMEARVPMTERGAYPVLVRGSHVLWLPAVCRSRADIPRAGEPALRIRAEYEGGDWEA